MQGVRGHCLKVLCNMEKKNIIRRCCVGKPVMRTQIRPKFFNNLRRTPYITREKCGEETTLTIYGHAICKYCARVNLHLSYNPDNFVCGDECPIRKEENALTQESSK